MRLCQKVNYVLFSEVDGVRLEIDQQSFFCQNATSLYLLSKLALRFGSPILLRESADKGKAQELATLEREAQGLSLSAEATDRASRDMVSFEQLQKWPKHGTPSYQLALFVPSFEKDHK